MTRLRGGLERDAVRRLVRADRDRARVQDGPLERGTLVVAVLAAGPRPCLIMGEPRDRSPGCLLVAPLSGHPVPGVPAIALQFPSWPTGWIVHVHRRHVDRVIGHVSLDVCTTVSRFIDEHMTVAQALRTHPILNPQEPTP